jgi:hypothetical protein
MKQKNFLLLFFIIVILVWPFESAEAKHFSNTSGSAFVEKTIAQNQAGRKRKDGRFKRKKGFMWGLFKGKSACDCPKH